MILHTFIFLLTLTSNPKHMNTDNKQVVEAVQQYISAGDLRNVESLDSILHPQFRVVANQLLGGSDVSIITKDQYLQLVRAGKLGGDNRTVEITSVEIIHNNAAVTAKLTGGTLSFESLYHLIRTNNTWQMVEDLPYAVKNN
jgi:Putative lumazine-binding